MKNTPARLLSCASASILLSVSTLTAAVTIDWVTVGNPGNAAQSASNRDHADPYGDGYGAVAYTYRMAQNETTIAQYAAFLNAVASVTDPYNLYNSNMATDLNIAGISRIEDSGGYTYSVVGSGNRPITYVSWFDAARMANWIHNGQPTGDQGPNTTEDGAYTLNGATSGTAPAKNEGAKVWIPTENEWFKAAYYDPTHMGGGGYWLHGNRSDGMTNNMIGGSGSANYYDGRYAATQSSDYLSSENYLTEVGIFGITSQTYYWLNDVAGNVWEWNDRDGQSDAVRGLRGGSWNDGESSLRSGISAAYSSEEEDSFIGFRFASSSEVSAIPEPGSTVGLMVLLSGAVLFRRKG